MRTNAYVTTWKEIEVGQVILVGGVPEWRTVTKIILSEGDKTSRHIRTDNSLDPEGYREYWAKDAHLVTVRDVH